MSIDEPTAIGTLVRLNDDAEVLLVKPGAPNPWWHLRLLGWCHWGNIKLRDPVIVHKGYTPEPTGEGAVVRYRYDGDCCWFVVHAIDDPDLGYRTWHHTDGSGKGKRWSDLPNDIEVLFEGVTE